MGWEPFSSSSQDLPTDLKSITILCRHSKWAWIFCTIPTEFQFRERPLMTFNFRFGRRVQNQPKQSHVIGYMVGRGSKIVKDHRTSFIEVLQPFFPCMLSSNSIAGNKYQFQLGYGISCTEYENGYKSLHKRKSRYISCALIFVLLYLRTYSSIKM